MGRMTYREKEMVAACYPTIGGYATKEEVKLAKLKARGHYWDDKEHRQFVAMNKNGVRGYFVYCHRPGEAVYNYCCVNDEFNYNNMRKEARRWSMK